MIRDRYLVVTFSFFFISFFAIKCSTPVFPDEQMKIAPTLAAIYKAIGSFDSIAFTNQDRKVRLFVITHKDSILENKKRGFLDRMPYNNWSMNFDILENGEKIGYNNNLFVNRDPTNKKNTIFIELFDFYHLGDTLPQLNSDTFMLGKSPISNFYRLTPNGTFGIDYAMEVLYIDDKTGFLGFEMQNGDVWVNDRIK